MKLPDFTHELKYWQKGYYVIGVDEVGRGAFAGPVTVGAVCLKAPTESSTYFWTKQGINDSKKLTPAKREILSKIILEKACAYSIVSTDVGIINKKGIVYAIEKAVRTTVKSVFNQLCNKNVFLLLDAFPVKNIPTIGLKNQKAIIHGDEISLSIAAASIIAKVHRDMQMTKLSEKYRIYYWQRNKGYGTIQHREAIKSHGPCHFHRTEYIHNLLSQSFSITYCES